MFDIPLPSETATIWRLASPRAKPIVVMHEGFEERHLYCVHSVTGDVAGLDAFASHFGSLRLHGIQVPKREMTEHLAGTIEAIARRHVESLLAYQPAGPIHLIGWSAGAIIALEMAQQLKASGRDVPLLVALDGAPCNSRGGLSPRDPRYLLSMLVNLPRWIRDDRSSDWTAAGIARRLSEKWAARRGAKILPETGLQATVLQEPVLEDKETLDAEAVTALISRPGWSAPQKAFVHTIYRAMATYVPRSYDGEVLVFETRTQPLLHLRQVGAAWAAIVGSLEIVPIEGNHSGLIREPTAGILAAQVIRRVRSRKRSPPSASGRAARTGR